MNDNAPNRKRKRLAEFDERLARESLDVHPARWSPPSIPGRAPTGSRGRS